MNWTLENTKLMTEPIWSLKVERYSVTFTELCGLGFIGEHFATKRARDCATQHGKVTIYREGIAVQTITNEHGNVSTV